MEANERQLMEMILRGEGIDLEFKTCRKQLNRDVYETVCAFLNRYGGTILLGVTDSGSIQGIEQDAVGQIKKGFRDGHQQSSKNFSSRLSVPG